MTKQDLIVEIAERAGVSKKAAGDTLNALIWAVVTELKSGGKVVITGFGSFLVSKRSARKGVNPRKPTETIQIPAMNLPVFKAWKTFKAEIR